jgi:osmotically-inducible protein OsmY
MKSLLLTVAVIATVAASVVVAKQEASPNPRMVPHMEDNMTAGDQSNKPADLETVKRIRRELMNDDALSTKAKNVKVIVANNGVTLKGAVKTTAEREIILKHAYTTAPKHRIYNQISVTK